MERACFRCEDADKNPSIAAHRRSLVERQARYALDFTATFFKSSRDHQIHGLKCSDFTLWGRKPGPAKRLAALGLAAAAVAAGHDVAVIDLTRKRRPRDREDRRAKKTPPWCPRQASRLGPTLDAARQALACGIRDHRHRRAQ